jgi:fluoroacetyl-CoA thioesterase
MGADPQRDARTAMTTITPGGEHSSTFVITTEMCTAHTGVAVFSTPAMIQLMENVAASSVQEQLAAEESSVGIHVCVSHVAGSRVGEEVTVRSTLREIERDRFLTFDVSAHVGDRLLGEGTHRRAVIDLSRRR